MKRLLLTLSVAATVTIGTVPLSVHAKNITISSVNCTNTLLQGHSAGKLILIMNDDKLKEMLKNLLNNCDDRPDVLFPNLCPDDSIEDTDISEPSKPENPAPEETQPAPPSTDNSKPQAPEPEIPKPQEPILPEDPAPESPAPEPALPEITPEPKPTATPPADVIEPSETEHPYILRVVELVNEERAKAGLNPVTLDKTVSKAALTRSKEIVNNFSHTRPNGSSFVTALKEQGVSYRRAGENIAWGQRSPEQVMNSWMNSSGHRANILGESFTHIGVGYYQENGVNYWTQLFIQ